MGYKFEGKLRERANAYVETLVSAGIVGSITPGSFRNYMVKVSVTRGGQRLGNVNLYYSPKKDRFTLKTHELRDKSVIPDLETCWDRLSSPHAAVDSSSSPTGGYHIYTDGSWLNGAIGYGVVILKDGSLEAELSGRVEDTDLQGMRQVGGELKAVRCAIEWCRGHDVQDAEIFYDYIGIEKWTTGEWKANKSGTRAYAAFLRDCPVGIRWHKVESHSGDPWNDRADQLAKRGAVQGQSVSQPEEQDPLREARDKASEFVELLVRHDIPASFQGVVNDQYARVVIGSRRGFLDVYNTPKRPVSDPYVHDFRDPSLKSEVENLWHEFYCGAQDKPEPAKGDSLSKATYYYEILRPYRDCGFDFIDLAQALSGACDQVGDEQIDTEALRLDFDELEAIYFSLEEAQHGE